MRQIIDSDTRAPVRVNAPYRWTSMGSPTSPPVPGEVLDAPAVESAETLLTTDEGWLGRRGNEARRKRKSREGT